MTAQGAVQVRFHGAAQCVTGFCVEVLAGDSRVLVDCGMFQGPKSLKALNYEPFPFDAASVDAVVLTHAHIDHSGLLPKLMKAGFEGPIYATAATRDLCGVMLPDAGGIQESEVRYRNRRSQRRGRDPVEPIYTAEDGAAVIEQFRRVKMREPVAVTPDIEAEFWPAGHILGAASILLRVGHGDNVQTLLFSGDLGPGSEFVANPQAPSGVDHLFLESTYGDRVRGPLDPIARRAMLAKELAEAHARGGPLLLPAFAVERTQELLVDLLTMMDEGAAPDGDVFLDSPLAIEATEVFLQRGWNPDSGVNPFEVARPTGRLRFLSRPDESDRLESLKGWHVIIAASGMCDAGRVRRHLKRLLWRSDATVLLTGYQAAGTLGRLLVEGAKRVTIQGEEIKVRAQVRSIDGYSGHADAEGLEAWAHGRAPITGALFLAHGEPAALEAMGERLKGLVPDSRRFAPSLGQTFLLRKGSVEALHDWHARLAQPPTRLDWHNQRTALLMDLNAALNHLPDDASREALIQVLRAQLPPAPDRGGGPGATAL